MNRVSFIVDGFNVYHSARLAQADEGGASTKWLNLRALCEGYLHLLGKDARLERVFYFSALAQHLEATKPDVTRRHRVFVEALQSVGVDVVMHRFQRNSIRCPGCNVRFDRYEEKETDVALAVKLLELFLTDACDTAVLVTGDTDLAPAVKTAQALFPAKRIVFAFPYRRKNKELAKLCPNSFEMNRSQYRAHQFPDPVRLPSGRDVAKPETW